MDYVVFCLDDQEIIEKEKSVCKQDQFGIKGTSSVGVQFDYIIPSIGKI